MKKEILSIVGFLMLCIGIQAQTNIANYTFASSVGTYVPLTGATTFTNSWDDEVSTSISLGGNFTYGAVTYTACYISANGFITFGGAPGGTNYTPLSTLGTTSAAISAFSQDGGSSTVAGSSPSISYLNIGGASGEFVVQYTDHANFSNRSTERLNFQIRLNLATSAINIIYGSWTVSGSAGTTAQVGIRGNSTAWTTNVNSLNTVNIPAGTSCSWADAITSIANNSSMYFNSANTAIAPSNGLTFTWAPPINASLAPVRTFSAVAAITATSATIAWTAPTSATQYSVQYRPNSSCSWTNYTGNPVSTNSVSLTGLTASTVYQIRVQSFDGSNKAIWSHIPNQAGTGGGYNTTAGTFSTLALPTDLQTLSLVAPAVSATGCYGSSIPLVIQLKNAGTTALDFSINNATILTSITGTNPQSFTTTVSTGTLSSNATLNVTVTPNYNMSATGVYTINASSTLATPDVNTLNDAMAAVTRTTTTGVNAPFTNNFNGFTGANLATLFPGWREAAGVTIPSGTTSGWLNQTGLNGTGNITAKINLFSNTLNEWILTPKFAVTSGVNLIFDAAITDYNLLTADPTGMAGTDDKVQVMVSTDCGNTFTSLLSITQTNSLTVAFTTFSVNLSAYVGQNVIIGFMASEGTINDTPDYDFHIDNINISNCFAPTSLTTSNITTTSTDISWNAPFIGSPASYFGEIRTSGAAGSGTLGLVSSGTTTAPTTTANITGLTASTAYTIYLQSNCGGSDVSQWISVTFTTLANCPVPTALSTSTVLASSANYTWTAGGSETAWDIYYGAQPLIAPNATTAPTATSSTNSYSATGLTQTTAYAVYVRANCGVGSTSAWTTVKNFTTPVSCPVPSTITISAITHTSAVASWVAGGSESSWLVKYVAPTTTVVTASPTYSLTGLNPADSYTVQVKAICAAADSSIWTLAKTFATPCLPPDLLSTTPGVRCGVGTITLAATTSSAATLNWYSTPTGGSPIGTGTVFTTPTLSTSTDFYVSALGSAVNETGGRIAPTTTLNTTASSYGLVFDVTKNFNLTSVDVYPTGTAGNLVVNLTNNLGVVLQTATIAIPTGTIGTPYTVGLNFPISVGTGYRLIAVSSPSMVRESALGGFPYQLGQVGNITSGYLGGTTATYYFFYNWNFSFGCESARTMVTATVNTAPVLSVTNGTTVCADAIKTLSVTSTLSDYDNYIWTPSSNLFIDAAATTSYTGGNASTIYYKSATINNSNYTINANNTVSGCVNTTSITMSATIPSIIASTNPTIICSGTSVNLTATGLSTAPGTVAIGTATTVTGATTELTAFCNRRLSYRMQTVYTAAELGAQGLSAGNINSIAYKITTVGDAPTNALYAVKMGTTSLNTFTDFVANTGFTTVFNPATYTHSVGLNTINFNSPYVWDGVSNLVIEVSHNGIDNINNAQTYYTTTANNMIVYSYNGNSTGTPNTNRLNIVIGGQKNIDQTSNFTWQWNPGAINSNTTTVTPVNTGTTTSTESYTVTTLDPATTCTNSAVVSFDVKPIPTVIATGSSASVCSGSSATLTASGATNYTWTAGGNAATEIVTPSTASIYTVTGEDNGCSNTTTVSVGVISTPTVMATSSNTIVCAGPSATLTASGATNYIWTSGGNTATEIVTPSSPTSYTVTGNNNGCSGTATISVGVTQNPSVSATASQTLLCDDGSTGSAILTASTTATSVLWSNGVNTMTTAVTPTTTTVYTVTATQAGCSANANITITVSNCNGIKEYVANEINVYPNPTNGILNVVVSSEFTNNNSVEIYDAIGKLVIKENLSNEANTINLSNLGNGIYVFKILNNNTTIKIGKVIKQ